MSTKIEEARARLEEVSTMLSWPLNKVLEQHEPDDYMKRQLEGYLPEWGERPLHEFMLHIKNLQPGEPDVINGITSPLNFFWILDEIYD